MITRLGAKFAAASAACGRHVEFKRPILLPVLAAIALALSGCMPATVPLAGADPADPAAKVARVGYRSAIAPYSSLRPATPAPWHERNDSVTPQPRPDR